MALEFRWFASQQVNELWHVAFHFRESCELRCCFLFFIPGCYFDHFLLSTHISLAPCLWKATSLPMREDDLASNCVFQLMSSV